MQEDDAGHQSHPAQSTPSPSATGMTNVIVLKKEGGLSRNVSVMRGAAASNAHAAFKQARVKPNDASPRERNDHYREKSISHQEESGDRACRRQVLNPSGTPFKRRKQSGKKQEPRTPAGRGRRGGPVEDSYSFISLKNTEK